MDQYLKNLYIKLTSIANLVMLDVESTLKKLWAKDKMFLLLLLPLIVAIKGRNILMSLLVAKANSTMQNATQNDQRLQQQENAANNQANALAQQAEALPATEKPIADDWYLQK